MCIAISCAAHIAVTALDIASPPQHADLAVAAQPSYVELAIHGDLTPPDSARADVAPRTPFAPEPSRALASTRRRSRAVAAPSIEPAHLAPPSPPASQAAPDVSPEPRTPSAAQATELAADRPSSDAPSERRATDRAPLDLSPMAAARSVVDVRAAPTTAPTTPAQAQRVSSDQGLEEYLAQHAVNPSLTRADDPKLEKTRDGYAFAGNGFDAEIERDGSVRFRDRYGSAEFKLKPQMLADGSFVFVLFGATFDLTAWAEHVAGNDPYRSERRWFLERTAALRERLASEEFRRRSQQAEHKLLRALREIWSRPSKGLASQKRDTFELWDECADDEIGARCRRIVEAHVADQCPKSSACAFDATDLARLNAHRQTRAKFAPYGPEE